MSVSVHHIVDVTINATPEDLRAAALIITAAAVLLALPLLAWRIRK